MKQDEVIDVLNDLVETSRDGQYGFQSCAEHVKSNDLRDVFMARAADCEAAVSELQTLVRDCGSTPDSGGSISGAVHRGWVAVKGTLSGYSDLSLLEECERGEDVAKAHYQNALSQSLPEPIRAVVEHQYQGVLRNHEQVRNLRNTFRATAA